MPTALPFELRELELPPSRYMVLSEDQAKGVDLLMSRIEDARQEDGNPSKALRLVLCGAAGTGKTSLLRVLIRRLIWSGISTQLLAPTGKAIARAREVLSVEDTFAPVSREARTIHSFLYGAPVETLCCPSCGTYQPSSEFLERGATDSSPGGRVCQPCGAFIPYGTDLKTKLDWKPGASPGNEAPFQVVIIDEASMVGPKVDVDLDSVVPNHWVILYVGDREQLAPIPDETEAPRGFGKSGDQGTQTGQEKPSLWGADFKNPTVTLTQVHRQAAGNPVLSYATAIREGKLAWPPNRFNGYTSPNDPRLQFRLGVPLEEPIQWLAQKRREGASAMLIVYTNALRRELNSRVRTVRGQLALAEKLGMPIVPGDFLLCRANNGMIFNGEIIPVSTVSWEDSTVWRTYSGGKLKDKSSVRLLRITSPNYMLPLYVYPQAIGQSYHIFRDGKIPMTQTLRHLASYADHNGRDLWTLLQEEGAIHPERLIHVDFAEGLTCHVCQGSQADHIGVIWDRPNFGMWYNDRPEALRWLYTAATRAIISATLFTLPK